jgi:hypothetical protein
MDKVNDTASAGKTDTFWDENEKFEPSAGFKTTSERILMWKRKLLQQKQQQQEEEGGWIVYEAQDPLPRWIVY